MSTTHSSHHPRREPVRKLDGASLALLILALVFGTFAYWLTEEYDVSALVLIPSIVAATTGALHLVKREAPRP